MKWHIMGISLQIRIYDILPLLHPEWFPEDADVNYIEWITVVSTCADRLITISETVANDLYLWLEKHRPNRSNALKVISVHLGANFLVDEKKRMTHDEQIIEKINQKTLFLMVGTIEPRKGYLQTLLAFDELWKQGCDICLLIVGNEGWAKLPNIQRRNIPTIIKKIRNNREYGKKLFWIKNASDEYLQYLYKSCQCLIAASKGEGFGLPLVEAMFYKLPVIARDIPVFREIIQNNACFF